MDKLTSLNLSFSKIIVQIIAPGIVAVFPYLLLSLHGHCQIENFLLKNPSTLITILSMGALIVGMILENLGGLIEVHFYDVRNKSRDLEFSETWEKYLQLKFEFEPIGQRYLRNILMRMKFELSMGIALSLFSIGMAWMAYYKSMLSSQWLTIIFLIILPIIVGIYLVLFEGQNSSKILSDVRKLLVEKYWS